jgi:hypothetical protein
MFVAHRIPSTNALWWQEEGEAPTPVALALAAVVGTQTVFRATLVPVADMLQDILAQRHPEVLPLQATVRAETTEHSVRAVRHAAGMVPAVAVAGTAVEAPTVLVLAVVPHTLSRLRQLGQTP